jgi:twitching motility protein PilI
MATRTSLKAFQEGLAARLQAAKGGGTPSVRLSFEAGGHLWVLPLEASGEVQPVPEIERVPLTRDWFLGVANLRGVIYGVTDFARFLGSAPAVRGPENRLLLVGQPLGINAALLVPRLAGLRNAAELEPAEEGAGSPAWTRTAWRDRDGRLLCELDAAGLMAHREFLEVALQ